MKLDELVSQLRQVYGTELRSVLLYGSAVAGEHIEKRSDYNVLIVLDSLSLDHLGAVGAIFHSWRDSGNPPPMIFTLREWQSSADVFPMEYADILERHRVLHGEDVTRQVEVSRDDLRLQVEQQALGKLLHLRRSALAAGLDGKEEIELFEESLSAIMVVFRGAVRLDGGVPQADYALLSADVGARAGFDAAPLVRIVEDVRGTRKIEKGEARHVLAGYLGAMESLVHWLDRFRT